jgi:hypothetical protein
MHNDAIKKANIQPVTDEAKAEVVQLFSNLVNKACEEGCNALILEKLSTSLRRQSRNFNPSNALVKMYQALNKNQRAGKIDVQPSSKSRQKPKQKQPLIDQTTTDTPKRLKREHALGKAVEYGVPNGKMH